MPKITIKQERLSNKRKLDLELERLEQKIEELRILYEQYFVDVLMHPPTELQRNVVRLIRQLIKAPFKQAPTRFRLRNLITRYQTYHTYWSRIMKEREDGVYVSDTFKTNLREREKQEMELQQSTSNKAEKSFRGLYQSYEAALIKLGGKSSSLNYESFKKALIRKTKQLKEQQGVTKLRFQIVTKDNKVIIKASKKE